MDGVLCLVVVVVVSYFSLVLHYLLENGGDGGAGDEVVLLLAKHVAVSQVPKVTLIYGPAPSSSSSSYTPP